MATQCSNKDISIKYKLAQKEIKSKKVNQTQTQVIYPDSVIFTYISPQATHLRFFLLTFNFVHPKPIACIPLDKSPLLNVYNSSYNQEDNNTLYNFFSTRRCSCTTLSLWVITINPIILESVCDHEQELL